jgi:hypothetical protein
MGKSLDSRYVYFVEPKSLLLNESFNQDWWFPIPLEVDRMVAPLMRWVPPTSIMQLR